jgi:hypothetical protein
VGFVVDKVALGRFYPSTSVSPANIIPPLLHIHLSPPHEVCDRSDQAAHYHNLGPKLGASLLTRHIGWKQKKKVKKNSTRFWWESQKERDHLEDQDVNGKTVSEWILERLPEEV